MNTNHQIITAVSVAAAFGAFLFLNAPEKAETPTVSQLDEGASVTEPTFAVTPVSHASFVLKFGDFIIANDPVGQAEAFLAYGQPNVVLVSDIHGDHLDTDVLTSLVNDQVELIAPQAVIDELPDTLTSRATLLENGNIYETGSLSIEAVPMYNLPMEGPDYRHVKGRGNGYLLQIADTRVYIAGDTEDIPEMRSLTDIDYAFVPMNLPYTMGIEAAADAVLDFAPAVVYPYHYRGPDGLSDVDQFAVTVEAENTNMQVVLLDWYPEE